MGYQLMISDLTVHGICAINTGERADNMQPFYVSTPMSGGLFPRLCSTVTVLIVRKST